MMFLWLSVMSAFAQDHTVVVSVSGQEIELTKREVKKMFTRQQITWTNDEELTVALPLLDSPAMVWLSQNVLGLPPEVYHRYLLEKAYRAGEDPPKFVATPTLVKGQVVITVAEASDVPDEGYTIVRIR